MPTIAGTRLFALVFGTLLPDAIARDHRGNAAAPLTVELRWREDIDEWIASLQADPGFASQPVDQRPKKH